MSVTHTTTSIWGKGKKVNLMFIKKWDVHICCSFLGSPCWFHLSLCNYWQCLLSLSKVCSLSDKLYGPLSGAHTPCVVLDGTSHWMLSVALDVHGSLPHFILVLFDRHLFREAFPDHSISSYLTSLPPRTFHLFPALLFSIVLIAIWYKIQFNYFIYFSEHPPEREFHEGRDLHVLCSLIYPQFLKQWLEHEMLVKYLWNEFMNVRNEGCARVNFSTLILISAIHLFHSFILQLLIKYLLGAKQFARCWRHSCE